MQWEIVAMGAMSNVMAISDRKWQPWEVRDAACRTMLGNQPAKLVLTVLAARADGNGLAFPRRETIARESGVALRTLQRVLGCLREIGLVEFRRVNQRERIETGKLHSEEFRLVLGRLGENLESEFEVSYARAQGKLVVPEESVSETHVSQTEKPVSQTEKGVSETHLSHSLLGRTSQELPSNTPSREEAARGVDRKQLRAAAAAVSRKLATGTMAVRLEAEVHAAFEAYCVETGETPAQAMRRMEESFAAGSAKGFMLLTHWVGGGHWRRDAGPVVVSSRVRPLDPGVYDGELAIPDETVLELRQRLGVRSLSLL